MSEHVHLIARLVAREGQEAALVQAMAALVPAVLAEPAVSPMWLTKVVSGPARS